MDSRKTQPLPPAIIDNNGGESVLRIRGDTGTAGDPENLPGWETHCRSKKAASNPLRTEGVTV